MNTAGDKMKVQIWSDMMCPFCYIGKQHFEDAFFAVVGVLHHEILSGKTCW